MKLVIVGGGGFRVPLIHRALLRAGADQPITQVELLDTDPARLHAMRRNPMDSIISFYRTMFFASPHVYPSVYDLENAAHHYVRFHRLADHWREVLPADRYLELSYETFVADQENQTRALLDFAGLPFDARSLDFHSQGGVVATASAVQVRRPIYDSSVGRWKRYGDKLKPAIAVLEKAGIPVD